MSINILMAGIYRQIMIDHDKKILLEVTRKCGTTALSQMFFNHLGVGEYAASYEKNGSQGPNSYYLHEFSKNSENANKEYLNRKDYFKFKIVRNPYDRAVSCYLGGYTLNIKENNRKDTFRDFLQELSKKEKSACFLDPHNFPQFKGEIPTTFNKIVKIENIEKEILEINNILKTNFYIPDNNKLLEGHHIKRNKKIKKFVGDKSYEYFKSLQIPNYKWFYNEELKLIVDKLYKKDLNFYNYSWEEFENYEKNTI